METNKQLIRRRFGRGFARYDRLAVVQQALCDELAGMIASHIAGPPSRALEIGTGTGFLTRRLIARYPDTEWFLNDIADESEAFLAPHTEGRRTTFLAGDAERLALPRRLDLVASASTVQWFDDLEAFAAQAIHALAPGGLLALSTFGPENFAEIRALTGESLEYLTPGELRGMLGAQGYTIAEAREHTTRLAFDTPGDVLRHIKATGVNSLRPVRWGVGRFTRFEREYRERFADAAGRVSLTYHPILVIARKPGAEGRPHV
ncbi:MAG: malonyl-ACP O-methyltransferase BioC [Rikenellaceae bacterium]|nr:malonyl-ACP O-methyltransferase BioC [Rikenellaceae bacterium]